MDTFLQKSLAKKIGKKAFLTSLSVFIFLVFSSMPGYAQERLGSLAKKAITPEVNAEAMNEWKKDIFEIDETWFIENKEAFFNSLRASGLNEQLHEQLVGSFRTNITDYESEKVMTFGGFIRTQGFLILSADLKRQLLPEVLRAAYSYLLQTQNAPPFTTFNSATEASAFFERFGLSGQVMTEVLNRVFEISGTHYFFYTRDIWPKLSNEIKMDLITASTSNHFARTGLQVDLTFRANDDLSGIADRYSGERDPRALERYLRFLLNRSQTGEVTIPLSKILHPFIRKKINTYATCTGANCFNSGVSVNEGNNYEQRYISDTELLDLAFKKYRFVNPSEQLHSGDLLLYRNTNGTVVHVSTYITDDIVYTKNGMSKFSPYLFQLRSVNEYLYFPDGKYKLMVLRVPKNGEAVVSQNGAHSLRGREVYYNANVPPNLIRIYDLSSDGQYRLYEKTGDGRYRQFIPSNGSRNRCAHAHHL